jgi:hypothetical protein
LLKIKALISCRNRRARLLPGIACSRAARTAGSHEGLIRVIALARGAL